MFSRLINISQSNSFFLFGARATGKSTLIRERFDEGNSIFIDLLKEEEFLRYATNTAVLQEVLEKLPKTIEWVIIDEVQKVPKLLDEVHRQIFKKRFLFALTGSSTRKLKRGNANMLAGRAFLYHLFPLTHRELGESFQLDNALGFGTLPEITHFKAQEDKELFLQSYSTTYVKEEVLAEQLVRGIIPFNKFLPLVGQSNAQIVNYSNIARDIGIDDVTVRNYYSILEDTMLGFFLDAHHTSIRKRQKLSPKFYLFDTGVARHLQGLTSQPLSESTYGYGKAFEHFIILEIFRLASYARKNWQFSYLKTSEDSEIDLIIERPGMPTALIEIKSARMVHDKTIHTLNRFKNDFPKSEAYIFCREVSSRRKEGVEIIPWQEGIKTLGI